MVLASDAASQPWWLAIVGIAGTILVAYLAARGPVWVERVKARGNSSGKKSPEKQVASAEDVLREWLHSAIKERDRAQREVERMGKRIAALEKELHRLGWDGRTA